MDHIRSKHFIAYMQKKWRIDTALGLDRIVDILYGGVPSLFNSCNTFEFSLVSSDKSLRLLHLNFYNTLAGGSLSKSLKKRSSSISRAISYIHESSGYQYDARIMNGVFSLSHDFSAPVQFGIVLNNKGIKLIKLYVSITSSVAEPGYLFMDLCRLLGLRHRRLMKNLYNMRLDAVGVDLTPGGSCGFKIYACQSEPIDMGYIKRLYGLHRDARDSLLRPFMSLFKQVSVRDIGLLWRVGQDSGIDSVKIWARLREHVPFSLFSRLDSINTSSFGSWFQLAGGIIDSAQSRISYLTLEDEKLGLYFR